MRSSQRARPTATPRRSGTPLAGGIIAWVSRALIAALLLGMLSAAVATAFAPAAAARPSQPARALHADLVRADPAPQAILHTRPTRVRLIFSEEVSASLSRARVVDVNNREVDNQDSQVSRADPREVDVGLPLVSPGVYVVVWRAQSTDDGHVTGGSFYFRIARPDGSIPPLPAVLPTGANPGASGAASTPGYGGLDGPTVVQALGTWLALLFLALWLGGLVWETWILPLGAPGGATRDPDLSAAAHAAERRFRRVAALALTGVLVADLAIVLGESAALAGDWSGAVAPSLLGSILFGSRFGAFWLLRELLALAALYLTVEVTRFGLPLRRDAPQQPAEAPAYRAYPVRGETSPDAGGSSGAERAITPWGRAVAATLRGIPRLPARLVRGWRARTWLGRVELLLGAALLVAFALSGHAAAVPATQFAYALGVDLLHLVAEAAWVGGLFYIAVVLLPALRGLWPRQRARVLALGLPEFGAVAIVCATLLAATGSLNTTIRLTSSAQFLTTTYGRTLAVKIELFLLMVGISAYHAFSLRPRLATALDKADPAVLGSGHGRAGDGAVADVEAPHALAAAATAAATRTTHARTDTGMPPAGAMARGQATDETAAADPIPGHGGATTDLPFVVGASRDAWREPAGGTVTPHPGDGAGTDRGTASLPARAGALAERLEDWLRREAFLGVLVLLCVALLAAFAGSLAPAAAGAAGAGGQPNTAITQTQSAGSLAVTLYVTPNSLGPNDFTVVVKDKQGHPVDGAGVQLFSASLEMDMGTRPVQMTPVGAADPGTYTAQGDLTMPGAWQVTVTVQPRGTAQPVRAVFRFDVGLGE